MSKRLIVGIFLAVVASAITASAVVVVGQGGGSGEGEYGTLYIDVGPLTGNTTDSYGTIDTCIGDLTVGTPFDIDIIIDGANDLAGAGWTLYYNKDVLKVTGSNWSSWKLGGGGMNLTDPLPDTDGAFATSYAGASGVNGAGVLLRLTLEPIATGSSDLKLCTAADCLSVANSVGHGYFYPKVLVDDPAGEVRAVVGGPCPAGGEGAGVGASPEAEGGAEAGGSPEPEGGAPGQKVRWGNVTVTIPSGSDIHYARLESAPEAVARGIIAPVLLLTTGGDGSTVVIHAETGQVIHDNVLAAERAAFDAVLATVEVVEAEVAAEPGAPWPYGSTLPGTPRQHFGPISYVPPDLGAGISVQPMEVDFIGPGPPWSGPFIKVFNSRSQMGVSWYGEVTLTGGRFSLAEFVEADPSLLEGIHPDDREAFQRFAQTVEISPRPGPTLAPEEQTP